MLPNDPVLLRASEEQLLFADYYKKQQNDAMFDRLAKLLGVKYSLEELRELVASLNAPKRKRKLGKNGGKGETPKELFIPLALIMNPQSLEVLKNAAKGLNLKTSNKSDLSSWDKDMYRDFMDRAIKKAADAKLQAEAASQEANETRTET